MDGGSRGVVVLPAGGGDAASLAMLFDAYRVFYAQRSDPAAARAFVEERLADGDRSVFFLASRRGEALGFARMWLVFSSIAMRPAWILEDLYVVPAERKNGVARALMARCELHARESGAAYISLETAVDNVAAQALYASSGYARESAFWKYNLVL